MTVLERINATVPKTLLDFAESRIESGGFGNKSEYIRHLIRKDQETARFDEIEYINRKLQESIASGLSNKTPKQLKAEALRVIKSAASQK